MGKARQLADLLDTTGDVKSGSLDNVTIADNAVTMAKIADADVVTLKSGRKNLIINGGFDVWQRGTSLTSAYRQSTSSGIISDRWLNFGRTSNPFDGDVVKVSDAPTEADATYSLKSTCTDASAFISNSYGLLIHRIEGGNCQHLNSTAYSNITLSFWVKANYTGKHSVNLGIFNATAQVERYHTRYDINNANTWEKKTVTIPLNNVNTIGTIAPKNTGLELGFPLGVDSTRIWDTNLDAWETSEVRSAISQSDCKNFFDTVGNTFQITGVQLELGSVATDFEHRSYGEELALCQRYYERLSYADSVDTSGGVAVELLFSNGFTYTSSRTLNNYKFQQVKRTPPTVSVSAASHIEVLDYNTGWLAASGFTARANIYSSRLDLTHSSGLTIGRSLELRLLPGGYISIDAEL